MHWTSGLPMAANRTKLLDTLQTSFMDRKTLRENLSGGRSPTLVPSVVLQYVLLAGLGGNRLGDGLPLCATVLPQDRIPNLDLTAVGVAAGRGEAPAIRAER